MKGLTYRSKDMKGKHPMFRMVVVGGEKRRVVGQEGSPRAGP